MMIYPIGGVHVASLFLCQAIISSSRAPRERQQRELEREQKREITERKIQTWKKTPSGQDKLQGDPTFMKALQRVAKQEDDRGKNMDDGKDRERQEMTFLACVHGKAVRKPLPACRATN